MVVVPEAGRAGLPRTWRLSTLPTVHPGILPLGEAPVPLHSPACPLSPRPYCWTSGAHPSLLATISWLSSWPGPFRLCVQVWSLHESGRERDCTSPATLSLPAYPSSPLGPHSPPPVLSPPSVPSLPTGKAWCPALFQVGARFLGRLRHSKGRGQARPGQADPGPTRHLLLPLVSCLPNPGTVLWA